MRVLFRSHLARGGLMGEWTPIEWLALVEHELLLFAAVFFLIGALDEFAVDLAWLWLRLVGQAETLSIDRAEVHAPPLPGPAAVARKSVGEGKRGSYGELLWGASALK